MTEAEENREELVDRDNVLVAPPPVNDIRVLFEYALQGRLSQPFQGYRHAEQFFGCDASAIHNERRREFERRGKWRGSFEELRICLFMQQRCFRHYGFDPEGEPLRAIEALADTLRKAPVSIGHVPQWQLAASADAAPCDRAYWVVKNQLLGGAYPGSPAPTDDGSRARELWDAGIRTFINLMEEKEVDAAGRPFRPYVNVVDEQARAIGSRATCVRFPIRDVSVPSVDRMRSIIDAIDLSLEAGRCTYVHCFGGVGRTATVIGCWMLRHGLATKGNFLEQLAKLRRADATRGARRAPETEEQIKFVTSWRD